MSSLDDRLAALDIGLFQPILSQTTGDDKRSLLKIQQVLRARGNYVYLEIGSHLGGTIQPYYGDPRCELIYSIDKRPAAQPDERGIMYAYVDNSTERMRSNLHDAFPTASHARLITFDADASQVDPAQIRTRPQFCFIDGEHTNMAVRSDFEFCRRVCADDAIIGFHDTCFVFEGVRQIQSDLSRAGTRFQGLKLGGSVYVILLGDAIEHYAAALAPLAQDEAAYFARAKRDLERVHMQNQYPLLKLLDVPKKLWRRLRRKVA